MCFYVCICVCVCSCNKAFTPPAKNGKLALNFYEMMVDSSLALINYLLRNLKLVI